MKQLDFMKLYQQLQFWNTCSTERGTDVTLPDDDLTMSKHVRVYMIYSCDIYRYDINFSFVGYNK